MDFSQKDPSSHWDTFSIEREECCSKAFSSQLHLKNGPSSLIIIWICPHSSKTWHFGRVTSPPNLLDQIFTQQLSDAQHELLLAFSVYRESVPLEAEQAIFAHTSKTQIPPALKALVTHHLIEDFAGE